MQRQATQSAEGLYPPTKPIIYHSVILGGLVLLALLVGCSSFQSMFHSVNGLVDNLVSQLVCVAWSFGLVLGHAIDMGSVPTPSKPYAKPFFF